MHGLIKLESHFPLLGDLMKLSVSCQLMTLTTFNLEIRDERYLLVRLVGGW